MFLVVVVEILDSGFYEVLWKQSIIVNVYDDVVVRKILKNREHLLHRLVVLLHPIENDPIGCHDQLMQILWQVRLPIGELLMGQCEVYSIGKDSVLKYRIYDLDAICYASRKRCHADVYSGHSNAPLGIFTIIIWQERCEIFSLAYELPSIIFQKFHENIRLFAANFVNSYMKMNKSYKFRLYPNATQRELLEQHFGAVRFIYNYFLEQKIKVYKETKKTIPWNLQSNEIPKLKQQKQYAWLKEVNSQSLQQAVIHLDKAYLNFFRSGAGFPKFKSKHKSRKSFCFCVTNDNLKLDYDDNKISIPKFIKLKSKDNRLKCKFNRKAEGTMESATISQDKDGKYYVSILCEVDMQVP